VKSKKAKAYPERSRRVKNKRQNKNSCLIVLDGEINKALLEKHIAAAPQIFISADGASNKLCKWKIIPDYIIGDLDSITLKALAYFKKKNVPIEGVMEQEHNDFEKCIKLALSKKIKNITVIGYGGRRSDHFLNNFNVMKRYYKKCRIRLIDKDFEIFFAEKTTGFNCKTGETVSLMAVPKAEGITTYGLQYPLRNESLEFGIREGTLNKTVKNKVRIEFKKGDLLIFKKL
jgi:thiamine pyrophosphokinase